MIEDFRARRRAAIEA
jgi:hypothetical protein